MGHSGGQYLKPQGSPLLDYDLELSYTWVSAKSSTEQWFVRGGVICRKEKSELGGQREAAAEGSERSQC